MKFFGKLFSLKYFLPAFVLSALLFSTAGVNLYLNDRAKALVYNKVKERLQSVGESIIFGLENMRGDFFTVENQKGIQRILEKTLAQRQFVAAYFVSPDLTILIDGSRMNTGERVSTELMPFLKTAGQNSGLLGEDTQFDNMHAFILARPVEGGSYDVAKRTSLLGTLVLIYDLRSEDQALSSQSENARNLILFATLLAGIFLYLIIKMRIVNPLSAIQDTVRSVAKLDFDNPAKIYFNDELGSVASAVNKMIFQLVETSVSKEYLNKILESMHDIMVVTDLSGKILNLNKAASDFLGIDGTVSEKENIKSFVDRDLIYLSVHSQESIRDYEVNLKSKNGNNIPVSATGSLIYTDAGRVHRVVLNLRDISLRRQIESDLEQTNLASASSSKMAALGEMAGGIAHEINNPLAVINTVSGQLKELIKEKNQDKKLMTEMAEVIEETVMRIAKIIKGLRSFSRDASRDPLESCEIQKIVDDTKAFCASKFEQNNINLVVTGLGNQILNCRPTEITQVLLNLLNNAFDAINSQKEKWINLHFIENENFLDIAVTDSGNGLPPQVQEKLFRPFFTTKPVGKGTGLGLGISKKIIENHGGDLFLDKTCKNTRFIIRLPVSKNETKLKVAA